MVERLKTKPTDRQAKKEEDRAVRKFQSYFKRHWNGAKPLAKLFRTDYHAYLYDTGNNKKYEKQVYSLLHSFFLKEVNQAINDFVARYG